MSLSLNNPLIIGDINKKTKEDISQLQQDIGDMSQLETADKSSLVNALNEAIDSTLNGASRDLDNLSDAGNDKLRSLNSYANEGELLTDADGLAFVENYAHSTFDLSKFTVVGSPTITDDGIASGFGQNKNIKTSNITFGTSNWEIKVCFYLNPNAFSFGNEDVISYYLNTILIRKQKNRVFFRVNPNDDYDTGAITLQDTSLDAGLLYYAWGYNSTTGYYLKKSTDGKSYITIDTNSSNLPLYQPSARPIWFGTYRDGFTSPLTNGSIDLKQFSITADGVEVFSGNKTGIDTIKPDDYTVVGSPTISADGIITNTDQDNNYIYIPETYISQLSTANTWKVKWSGILQSSGDFLTHVFSNGTGTRSDVFLATRNTNNINNFSCIFYVNNDGTKEDLILNATLSSLYNGKKYTQSIEFTGTQYIWTYQFEGEQPVVKSVDSTYKLYNYNFNDRMHIGIFTDGSIDLNAFKIYVDGNLVYQPCLKIPYTESKTGSKIVGSIYRDRVNDMAEQFGFAPYYTLSDNDFTLPQVELYGLIGQRTLRDSYRNGINYWELYSNRDLEQGGSCTSGVEVTFARPFADTNYVLSVPYSAKSSTAFTPTQTGDWIAKGRGLL